VPIRIKAETGHRLSHFPGTSRRHHRAFQTLSYWYGGVVSQEQVKHIEETTMTVAAYNAKTTTANRPK
jgi:hypothetical protein